MVLIALSLFGTGIEFAQIDARQSDPALARTLTIIDIILILVTVPIEAISILGFIYLGLRDGHKFLTRTCLVYLVTIPVITFPILMLEFMHLSGNPPGTVLELALFIPVVIAAGIVTVVFGIALWMFKDSLLYRAVATINVITGLLMMTVLLTFLAMFIQIPLLILEAWLLSTELKKKEPLHAEKPIEPILIK